MLKSIFVSLFLLGLIFQSSASANEGSENGYVDKEVMVEVSSSERTEVSPAVEPDSITVTPVSGRLASSYPMSAAQTVSADAYEKSDPQMRASLIPMVGTAGWIGAWNYHVTNRYTLGMILEAPVSRNFSLEVEGSYGDHGITYSSYSHNFNLFGLGANGKLYLVRGVFNPYIGAGMMGLMFNGMTRGPNFPYQTYDHWLGSGQLMAGGDIALSRDISIGVRGAFIRPLINRPTTYHNGVVSFPGFEEAAAISTSFYRLMAAVRVAL